LVNSGEELTFEVLDQPRPPLREWFLNRVRITYRKQRKYVKFIPTEGCLEYGADGVEKSV
jgi:hypothetical protein